MYLHLGNEQVILTKKIIGIFDIENTSVSKNTKDFLYSAEKNGNVIYVTNELPKSFVVCKDKDGEKVYISQISAATLKKRAVTK
jgi:hypothetical protein